MKHGWEYKQIGDICEVINGLWTGKKPPFVNVGVIRNTNFTKECTLDPSNIFYTDVEVKAYAKRKLQHGDIIIEKSGGSDKQPVGRPILFNLDGEFSFSNFTSVLRIKEVPIIAGYLHRALTGIYFQGKTRALQSKTTGIHNLDLNKYLRLTIPVPPLPVQKQICSLLDKMNRVIEAKKEQLKELDNLAQAIFYDMFGDPVTNEKGWSIDRLEANCEVSSAKRVLVEDVIESGIPFLRGTELTALSKSVSSKNVTFTMFITPEHYERVKAVTGVPKKGDILIPSINSEGIAWVVDTDEPFYFKDGRVIWVHVNTSVFVSQYLSSAITRILKTNYSLLTSGATFLELKLFIIRDLPTPIPPLPLQQAFAEKVEAIERQKELINQSLREVQTLFDSRMDYWFSEEDDDLGQLDKLD